MAGLKAVIDEQLIEMMRSAPPADEYQRGYAEALHHSWTAAGLPETPQIIAVRAMARAPYSGDGPRCVRVGEE